MKTKLLKVSLQKYVLLVLLLGFSHSYGAKIIFDLGDVLLHQNGLKENLYMVYVLGPLNIANYFYQGNKSVSEVYNRIWEFSDKVFGKNCKACWFKGEISAKEIVDKILEDINKKEHAVFFKNHAERELVTQAANLLLPENLVKITSLDKEGFNVVKRCLDAGNELFILSNWDLISIELIKNKFPMLFELFKPENIIISGYSQKIKPHKEAFTLVIGGNDPNDFYFIDDQEINIDAANSLMINGILHKDWKTTTMQLIEKKVLKEY